MIATQHTLVARMRSGVCNADWQRFYALYEKPILAFAAARSLNEADCCDVLQETMVRMFRVGFARFDPAKGKFTGFLFNIARCCVVDALRRRSRSDSRHVSLEAQAPDCTTSLREQLPGNFDSPADIAQRHAQMALVLVALDFLIERKCFQPKTVELFKAATLEQKDANEIATAFGTSAGNVYQAKHTVLAKLRTMLDGLETGKDLDEALAS